MLKIIPKKQVKALVYFGEELQGNLMEKSKYEFDKPQNFTLRIKTKYPIQTITEDIILTKNNPSKSVVYDPPSDIYQVNITNPNDISANILVNNTNSYKLNKSFNQTYENELERNYKISAVGYENTTFVAKFSQKLDWEFEYNPESLLVSLIITNTPAGGEIIINDETLPFSTEKNETIIRDLEFGKQYKVSIKKYPEFKVFTNRIRVRFPTKTCYLPSYTGN